MRITGSMMIAGTLRDLNRAHERLGVTQTRMSTGRQLLSASDDPPTAVNVLTIRRTLARHDTYDRTVQNARGWLAATDLALTSSLETLGRAKELAVRAANSGGLADPAARTAIAAEMRAIRQELLSVANTRHEDRSVFGGTAPGDAYDATGVLLGNTDAVLRDVDPTTTVRIDVPGARAFGDPAAPDGDLFAVLERLAVAVGGGNSIAIATAHRQLDGAIERVASATVEVGARARQLETLEVRNGDERQRLSTLLSEAEDVDLAEVFVTLKAQENAYQAALQVAARVLPMSLVDFLR